MWLCNVEIMTRTIGHEARIGMLWGCQYHGVSATFRKWDVGAYRLGGRELRCIVALVNVILWVDQAASVPE